MRRNVAIGKASLVQAGWHKIPLAGYQAWVYQTRLLGAPLPGLSHVTRELDLPLK